MRQRWLGGLAVALALGGCADNGMGTKETIGTGAGALLGGLAGSFIGSGSGRIVAIAAGVAVGGLIGNRIGAALDQNDQQALAAHSQQAIQSSADNTPVSWKSDHTDATATITPENSRIETRPISVIRDSNVAPAPELDPIGRTYEAKTMTNIRLAPTADSGISGTLAPGNKITAVGKVRGEPWIMVARSGRAIGYVSAANLEPVPPRARAPAAAAAPASAQPTFDLDSDAPVRSAADLDALPAGTTVDKVTASVLCRDIKTTVTSNGQSASSTQAACKSPDGTWELM